MAEEIRYVPNEAAIAELTTHTSGLVGQTLAKIGVSFESRSKTYASGQDGGPNVDTGNLRSSITWEIGSDGEGLYVDCGSNVEYAIFLELGTRFMRPYKFIEPAAREAVAAVLGA